MINSNFKKTRKQCVIFSVEEKLDYVKLMNKANIKAIKPKRRHYYSNTGKLHKRADMDANKIYH